MDTFTDLLFWMMNASKNTSTTTPMSTPAQIPESRVRPVGLPVATVAGPGSLRASRGCGEEASDVADRSLMTPPPLSDSDPWSKAANLTEIGDTDWDEGPECLQQTRTMQAMIPSDAWPAPTLTRFATPLLSTTNEVDDRHHYQHHYERSETEVHRSPPSWVASSWVASTAIPRVGHLTGSACNPRRKGALSDSPADRCTSDLLKPKQASQCEPATWGERHSSPCRSLRRPSLRPCRPSP